MQDNVKLWQEQAKALGGDAIVRVIEAIFDDMGDMKSQLQSLDQRIVSAFPSGDLDGHRRYHELMIRRNEELRSLRIAIQEKTISGLVWAAVLFIGLSIWNTLKQKALGIL